MVQKGVTTKKCRKKLITTIIICRSRCINKNRFHINDFTILATMIEHYRRNLNFSVAVKVYIFSTKCDKVSKLAPVRSLIKINSLVLRSSNHEDNMILSKDTL